MNSAARRRAGADQAPTTGQPAAAARRGRASARAPMPGEYDRYNMQRLVSMTANIDGEDLGRVAGADRPGAARRPASRRAACTVDVRGQIAPMQRDVPRPGASAWGWPSSSIFLLLTAYFQSLRLALVVGADGAGRARRRGAGAAGDRHDAEHPVVHGRDHGHRRGGGQRHPAGHVRRTRSARGRAAARRGRRRRPAPAAADPDDQPAP